MSRGGNNSMKWVAVRPDYKHFILVLGLAYLVTVMSLLVLPRLTAAACAALPTDRGTVTTTINIASAGTYRVFSRMLTADSTKNSFYMSIDDGSTLCNAVVGGSSIPANTWTWVNYHDGNSNAPIDVALTAGTHKVVMAGKDDNVEVDRIIFTQDLTCPVTGTGDNCAQPPDTTSPIVSLTAPATNASITSATTVAASASDNVGVTRVEFYLDGALQATDTATPYNWTLDPKTVAAGAHQLTAKAYDAAGNSAVSAVVAVTVPAADTVAPIVTITSPTDGATVKGTVSLAARASDNVAVTKGELYVGTTLTATTISAGPFSYNYDTTKVSNGTMLTITYKAYDAAGNVGSQTIKFTVNNSVTPPPATDTTPPSVTISAPSTGSVLNTDSGATYPITALADDASGIKQVVVKIDGIAKATLTAAPYTYTLTPSTLSCGQHTLTAVATDNSSNQNTATSSAVTVTTTRAEDLNLDCQVNMADFSLFKTFFGKTGSAAGRADFNSSGSVGMDDFSLFKSQFGK